MVITGVPKLVDENKFLLQKTFDDTFKNLNIGFNSDDMIDIFRDKSNWSNNGKSNEGAPIVIRFKTSVVKKEVHSRKQMVGSTFAKVINQPDTNLVIYVNENLTPYYANLFKMARVLKYKAGYKYIWTKEGKVFIKKDDGESTTVVRIRNFLQLKEIFKSNGLQEPPINKAI